MIRKSNIHNTYWYQHFNSFISDHTSSNTTLPYLSLAKGKKMHPLSIDSHWHFSYLASIVIFKKKKKNPSRHKKQVSAKTTWKKTDSLTFISSVTLNILFHDQSSLIWSLNYSQLIEAITHTKRKTIKMRKKSL